MCDRRREGGTVGEGGRGTERLGFVWLIKETGGQLCPYDSSVGNKSDSALPILFVHH